MQSGGRDLRELCALGAFPSGFDSLVNGTRYGVFSDEMAFDEVNFTCNTAFDGLAATPGVLCVVGSNGGLRERPSTKFGIESAV